MECVKWARAIVLLVALVTVGCGSAAPVPRPVAPERAVEAPPRIKHLSIGMAFDPALRPNADPPARAIVPMVHAGLTVLGEGRQRRALLAEGVPSLENGLWTLQPDGRMETTWHLREGVRWHDGMALTTGDLVFSLEVGRDAQMSGFGNLGYAAIDRVEAADARTLKGSWKEPYIGADALFDAREGTLLPRHLLETAYQSDKATFQDLPYWSSQFVGAGPYRMQEWDPGVSLRLEANADFVLGRPAIDLITVRYIPDANTLAANLLSGTVDVAPILGSLDLAMQLQHKWREGQARFNFGADNWIALFPQFIDAQPAAVTDLRFRRALIYAINRQEIIDTLAFGLSPIPHSLLSPEQAAYQRVEVDVPRYEYDPRRAALLLESMGYQKGPDGIYQDETGQRLEVEIRSGPQDQAARPAEATAHYWQQLGINATAVRPSAQQFGDLVYQATFPSFLVVNGPNDLTELRYLHSALTRLSSNNYRAVGIGNRSRYMNPEFDALLETYFRTIPTAERIQALGQIVRHVADQATVTGLFYNPTPGAVADRVMKVSTTWPGTAIMWNVYEWDVRG
jgi:peptide/nickel transport system substrate-binding protein